MLLSRGTRRQQFDGQHLRGGKLEPDREPIRQATAQASWLKRLLFESTGKTFSVTPVVVFPGWFVEPAVSFQDVAPSIQLEEADGS
jgi:hypothetical protein